MPSKVQSPLAFEYLTWFYRFLLAACVGPHNDQLTESSLVKSEQASLSLHGGPRGVSVADGCFRLLSGVSSGEISSYSFFEMAIDGHLSYMAKYTSAKAGQERKTSLCLGCYPEGMLRASSVSAAGSLTAYRRHCSRWHAPLSD